MTARPDIDALAEGVLERRRGALARAITLVESRHPEHREVAGDLLERLLPRTGGAVRLGITGVPGVGKSTLIDAFGSRLIEEGRRVAVLAVDPSSTRTGGSILGDKTRMARLSASESAFVRPSPSAGTLGGVAARTREAMFVCEAAGFDVVLVETVGIGQSETAVADLVDTFLVLALPGAGDQLQGIKKGVVEIADIVAVNKADGTNEERARAAASDYRAALDILTPAGAIWTPPVQLVSGQEDMGLQDLWASVLRHRDVMQASHAFLDRRADQDVRWLWALVEERMRGRLDAEPEARERIEKDVRAGRRTPTSAAAEMAALIGL